MIKTICSGMVAALSLTAVAGEKSMERTFGDDVAFLKQHTGTLVLQGPGGARVAVVPAYQGRVMTSTASGETGASFGWLNYPLIAKGIRPIEQREGLEKHILALGGEERFWLGPEGGQHAIFFPPGTTNYVFEVWKTPALIDTEPFAVASSSADRAVFTASGTMTNVAGAKLDIAIERTVRVLGEADVRAVAGVAVPDGVRSVGYETDNRLKNAGRTAWTRETGLLSIWMLGMFKHGPQTKVVIPVKDGAGPAVNSDYFGAVGPELMQVKDQVVYFKAHGKARTKIGIPPARAKSLCGSWDPVRGVLTLVKYNLPAQAETLPYVRSQWSHHADPYAGDVINAYNDGPNESGEQLGPFYEIESSSPALPLEPGAEIRHVQQTVHLQGAREGLDAIARTALGVGLDTIEKALP